MADTPSDVQDAPAPEAEAPAPETDPIMDILMDKEPDTPAESSPDKPEPEVAEKTEKEVDAPAPPDVPVKTETEGEEADVADDTAETAPAETQTQPQGKAEERKQQLNTEIRDLVAQRNALKTEVEKINSEVYQPATEEELVAEGMSATDAKLEALSQKLEVQDYNNRVAEAQLTIESESQRVLREFPIFDKSSPDYREEIAQEAAGLLNDNLVYDQNTGQVIGSNVSPYKLYSTIAKAYQVSAQAGQLKGQQDTEKMIARADNPGGSAPKSAPKDPIMEILLDDSI